MSETFPVTERTRVIRQPVRATYDKATVFAILDEALLCHVAFVVDGQPYAVPMAFARDGECLYLHGSAASRMARGAGDSLAVGVTVTLVDGLVFGRAAIQHSMNHRCVMVLGQARLVTDADERLHALRLTVNHMLDGRWEEVRAPNEQELKATAVLAVPLDEVSAKIRTGPAPAAEADLSRHVWAGVVPVRIAAGPPESDPHMRPDGARLDERRITARLG